ncbi:hypothetical protein OE88DRAFT_1212961 [Heliocybe sulcata]|uniref:Uncharacterized protein n=1 Tax=Heliocybe sulcata TaxID=5364 RepID=A0A5C3ML86_9AGAM|nr:hypothetical protein OE88DRAFT_1212961 [Heliocybe sulcata]
MVKLTTQWTGLIILLAAILFIILCIIAASIFVKFYGLPRMPMSSAAVEEDLPRVHSRKEKNPNTEKDKPSNLPTITEDDELLMPGALLTKTSAQSLASSGERTLVAEPREASVATRHRDTNALALMEEGRSVLEDDVADSKAIVPSSTSADLAALLPQYVDRSPTLKEITCFDSHPSSTRSDEEAAHARFQRFSFPRRNI